jgi:hypothetical protein
MFVVTSLTGKGLRVLSELDLGTGGKGVNPRRSSQQNQEALVDIQRQWCRSGSLGSLGGAARLKE